MHRSPKNGVTAMQSIISLYKKSKFNAKNMPKNRVKCGGTIINSEYILTSAECCNIGRDPYNMIWTLAEHNRTDRTGKERWVS